jgi:transcriptional regulator with XRE-family HTH domain
MPRKRKTRLTATEAIRQGISESGLNFLQLERQTGVLRQSLMKFARGEQSLRLDVADELMAFFGITVAMPPQPQTRKPRSPKRNKA